MRPSPGTSCTAPRCSPPGRFRRRSTTGSPSTRCASRRAAVTSLAQPVVAEPSTEAEQADAPGRAPPEPDVETGLDDEFLARPSAVPLDPAALIRLLAPMLGLDPARIAVTPGPPA